MRYSTALIKSVSRYFPDYSGPGKWQKISFGLLALIIYLVQNIAIYAGNGVVSIYSIVLTMFVLLLVSCGWFAPVSELLYIICFILFTAFDSSNPLSFLIWGISAISISWIIRSWIMAGIIAISTCELLLIVTTETLLAQSIETLLNIVFVITMGLSLRSQRLYVENVTTKARVAHDRAEAATKRICDELAAELHDTIAKDMARLVILSSRLAQQPETATHADFKLLSEIAQGASRNLRPLIQKLDLKHQQIGLMEAIEESKAMLTTRQIQLQLDMTPKLEQRLSMSQMILASLFVRESAANVLKYAPGQSEVNLMIAVDADNELSLTMVNDLGSKPEYPTLQGGFGLHNLESKIADAGGELLFGKNSLKWIISTKIPSQARGEN